jgi:hypothetical protein
LRLRVVPLLLGLAAAGCSRCGSTPATTRVSRLRAALPAPNSNAWDPVPSKVADALALRHQDDAAAFKQLKDLYADALDAGDARTAAIALHRAGDVAADQLELVEAENDYLRAYALHRLRGDERLAGLAMNDLGLLKRFAANDAQWFAEAVRLRRQAGTPAELRLSLNNLGGRLMLDGRLDEGRSVLTEAAAMAADAGDATLQRKALINLAACELADEAPDGGLPKLAEARRDLLAAQALSTEPVCGGLPENQVSICEELLAPPRQ